MIHLNAILFNTQKRGWDKSPSLSIIFGLSSKTQWLSGLYYTDFISFYSPTQPCGGETKSSLQLLFTRLFHIPEVGHGTA